MSPEEQAVRRFVTAFNRSELDDLVATLDPEVELHSMRGLRKGRDEARAWATKAPGGVQQTIEIKSVEVAGGRVLMELDRVWRWAEDGTLASTDEMAWLFTTKDGLITSWRPFDDVEEARAAFLAG